MSAGNGFLTIRPDARFGDTAVNLGSTETYGGKFTVPGSGNMSISEIGIWGYSVNKKNVHLAIFENDAVNGVPSGTLVANSDIVFTQTDLEGAQYGTYSGTIPVVVGGIIYWLAIITDGTTYYRFQSGGVGAYVTGMTYPTWPTDAQWHVTPTARNLSLYAVYAAAGGLPMPVAMAHYNQLRRAA